MKQTKILLEAPQQVVWMTNVSCMDFLLHGGLFLHLFSEVCPVLISTEPTLKVPVIYLIVIT